MHLMYLIKNNNYYYNKKKKRSHQEWKQISQKKKKPLNVFSLQVNHNLSEIRRLFNPPIQRMGNRRKEEGGGGGGGRGRLRNFKPNQNYNTNKQVQ